MNLPSPKTNECSDHAVLADDPMWSHFLEFLELEMGISPSLASGGQVSIPVRQVLQ